MGRLVEKIKGCQLICIDTNSFIYLMENNPKYVDEIKSMFKIIESGSVFGVSSMLVITELLTKPYKDGNQALINRYKAFINTFPNLHLRQIDYKVLVKAAKLRAVYGIKTPDAIFVATGIEEGAKIFVTNDKRLKNIEGIEFIILDDFI
jgi:predicted nucleic acid-binding protein